MVSGVGQRRCLSVYSNSCQMNKNALEYAGGAVMTWIDLINDEINSMVDEKEKLKKNWVKSEKMILPHFLIKKCHLCPK